MGKDPAFLFYSKDWITDTSEMSDSECRVLLDLMCYNHINGDLPADENRLARQCRKPIDEFKKIWENISSKFEPNGNRLVNRRLKLVMEERSKKSHKNTIIGIFASLIRKSKLNKTALKTIKNAFDVNEFINNDPETVTERLTEWFALRLKSIGNGNGNEDVINKPLWKQNTEEGYLEYRRIAEDGFNHFYNNLAWIANQKELNTSGLLIRKSMDKMYENYWSKKSGWKNKRDSKTIEIDWEATIINGLSMRMNQVWIGKDEFDQEQFEIDQWKKRNAVNNT